MKCEWCGLKLHVINRELVHETTGNTVCFLPFSPINHTAKLVRYSE